MVTDAIAKGSLLNNFVIGGFNLGIANKKIIKTGVKMNKGRY